MRLRIPALLILIAGLTVAASATAREVGEKDNGLSLAEERYLNLYEKAYEEFGKDVGANLVDDGTGRYEPYNLPESLVNEKADVLERWLNPPEPVQVEQTTEYTEPVETTYTEPAPAPVSSGGCPASMAPESGSAGYSAYNPSSGATGCYQIIPSTAAAHGCDLSTPAGQDACAAAICETQGNAAWAASGAAPCG